MHPRIRCLAWLGLGFLLIFGSVGDSQTPAGGLPPWSLQTATDVNALRVALESTRGQWDGAFQSRQTVRDISFRPLLTTSLERIFIGSVRLEGTASWRWGSATRRSSNASRPARSASPPFASGLPDGVVTLGYLHILGSGCQTPPDQVYTAFSPQPSPGTLPKNSLRSPEELDYLLHVLEGVAGRSSDPEFTDLHNWFTTQPGLRLANFQIQRSGAQFTCQLFFQSVGWNPGPDPVRTVHAQRLPGGGFGQVVIK